jgi:hypothetical protein
MAIPAVHPFQRRNTARQGELERGKQARLSRAVVAVDEHYRSIKPEGDFPVNASEVLNGK